MWAGRSARHRETIPLVKNSVDVACFGELLWDFFEADAKTEKEPIGRTFRRELGGATANVATVLARLGVKVSAIGAVGADKLGQALTSALDEAGVDVSHVAQLPVPTGLTLVTRSATGEPSFVPYRAGTADVALREAHVPSASAKAGFVLVSSTSMLPDLQPATEKFLAAAEKAKAAIVVDLNVRVHLWSDAAAMKKGVAALAERATVVKGSDKDLAAVAGKRGMTWLEENAKGKTWILTRGENGAACVGPHGQVTAPTKRVRCIDATGAGDAFIAGVLAVLAKSGARPGSSEWKDGKTWTRALEVGHLLGAKAISAMGATAGLLSVDDVKARIGATKRG
jgi:fructokinase